MHDLVSIIVPVYKVEPYLRKCLDSALAQTYDRFEVIVVDDGSPDACPAICDEYAQADPRVRVIHQANGGLSAARNTGLDEAQGRWVYFMDSDDWIEPDIIEACVGAADGSGASLVVFDHVREEVWGQWPIEIQMAEGPHSSYEALTALYQDRIDFGSWHFFYERRLFDDLRFPVGELSEDVAILHQVVDAAGIVYILHKVGYHYLAREGSITHTNDMNWWETYQTMRMVEYAREKYPELVRTAEARAAKRCFVYAFGLGLGGHIDELRELRARIQEWDLHPYGLHPRARISWHMHMASPELYIPVTRVWCVIRDHLPLRKH